MSIACPYCKAVLAPKGLKPGRYTPKCPKCGNPFILIVPKEPGGTISVQQLVPPKKQAAIPDTVRTPAVKSTPAPETDRLPAQSSPPGKIAPPNALTDKIITGGIPKPPAADATKPPKTVSIEDAAAAMLEGQDPGDIAEPDASLDPK
jgi:eukaryotic-like serine/threonine-protein kinase